MDEATDTPVALPGNSTAVVRPDTPRLGSSPLARAHRAIGWLRVQLLTLAAGAGAAVPVIVSTVHAVQYRWEPTDDKATIAARAYDVFTSHTPLVGPYSMSGDLTGHVVHNLGPMLFWLLAVPARFGSPVSMAVTMGVVNTLAIVATVALARARGGRVLMFATAVAVALMCQSLAGETFHDTWNASAQLFPFMLLIFLCWSVACGAHRLLPVTVLVASFVSQVHLAYVLPTLGLLVIAVGGLAASRIVRRRSGAAPQTAGRGERWSLVRWGLAAVVVGAICWTAPVIDQAVDRPGNLTLVLQTATAPKATWGAGVGWHAVVHAVGFPRPWWLLIPTTRWDRYQDVLARPHALRTASTVVLLGGLVIVMLVGLWRRRGDLAAAALIGLVLCGALGAVAAETPSTPPRLASTVGYTLWWGSQVGMWVWLILAWAGWLVIVWAARALPSSLRRRAGTRSPRVLALASVLASLIGVGAAAAAGGVVASTEKRDQHIELYRPLALIGARLDRTIPSGRTVLLEHSLDAATLPLSPAIRYLLARRNVRPLAPGASPRNGDWYELHHRPYDYAIYVNDRPKPPVKGVTLVIRTDFTDVFGQHTVSVWMSRARRHHDQATPGRSSGLRAS